MNGMLIFVLVHILTIYLHGLYAKKYYPRYYAKCLSEADTHPSEDCAQAFVAVIALCGIYIFSPTCAWILYALVTIGAVIETVRSK